MNLIDYVCNMQHLFKSFFSSTSWKKIKYGIGYSLFFVALFYGFWNAPTELFQVSPGWFLLAVIIVLIMFLLQLWQVLLFLRNHCDSVDWIGAALFNARKGVLNTLLPARSGTFLLLHTITKNYPVKWHQFVVFLLIASLISILISVLAAGWLLLPVIYNILILFIIFIFAYYAKKHNLFIYATCVPELLIIAFFLYLSTLMAFFCLLRGLGFELGLLDVSYLAIVLNILTQISITPGNMGIREVIVGFVSPYIALPISIGIIASSLVFMLRISIYAALWIFLEWYYEKR